MAYAEDISAGKHRPNGQLIEMPLHRLHFQAVGQDESLVSQAFPKQPGKHARRQRGGNRFRFHRGKPHMRAHDGRDSFFDKPLEGNELYFVQALQIGVYYRQTQVRIHGGIAVAGKMLGCREHSGRSQTTGKSGGQLRDGMRILPEAAHGDNGIARVDVYIGHGRKIKVEAKGHEFGAADRTEAFHVAKRNLPGYESRGDCHGARNQGYALDDPRHRAAFLIYCKKRRDSGIFCYYLADFSGLFHHEQSCSRVPGK